jgi:hypothetical protein
MNYTNSVASGGDHGSNGLQLADEDVNFPMSGLSVGA